MAVAVLLGGALCHAVSPDDKLVDMPFVYRDWQTFTTADGLPHDSIRAIHVQGDKVWVGTEGGLAMLEGGVWTTWPHLAGEEGVPPVISDIGVDTRTQDLWLGTWGDGLIRYSAGRFDRFDQKNSGLAGNLVFALAVTDDRIWAATNGGISAFDPVSGIWELHLERRVDVPETVVTDLSLDRSAAALYAGAWCDGLWRIDLGRAQVVAARVPTGCQQVSTVDGPADNPAAQAHGEETERAPSESMGLGEITLALDLAEGALWWATPGKLLRRDGTGTWDARSVGGRSSAGRFVYCLAARSATEAWLGTDQGLWVLADWSTDTWVHYRKCETGPQTLVTVSCHGSVLDTHLLESAIPDNRIRCVAFGSDDVWVGTARGLARGVGSGRWAGLRPEAVNRTATQKPALCPTAESPLRPPPSSVRPTIVGVRVGPGKPVMIGVVFPLWKTVLLPGQGPQPTAGLRRVDPLAVQLAVEQANARGGYRGRAPFEIALNEFGYARWGWNMPEDGFVTLAQVSGVRGTVAYLGPGSRFAIAAALRTEVPVVNAAPAPPTIDEVVNPWIFRSPGDDPDRQQRLLDSIFDQPGHTRVAVVRTPERAAQTHLDLWVRHARDVGGVRVADIPYDPQTGSLDQLLEAIQRCRAQVVFTWCDADVAAAILRRLRQAGMTGLFVGGERIVVHEFAELVGGDPGPTSKLALPVIALWTCSAGGDESAEARFAASYEAAFKKRPPPEAVHSYDAARHLLRAIDLAGPDREAIRRTLQEMGTAGVARLEEGRWRFTACGS